jgi:hypothetical protein
MEMPAVTFKSTSAPGSVERGGNVRGD